MSVRYFVDKKKEEGEDIEIVDSAWGPFAQMPDEVFGEYLELRNTLDVSNMLYLSIPLFYFLKQTELNPINLCVVSRSVVTLESKVCEEFKAWYRGIKEKN